MSSNDSLARPVSSLFPEAEVRQRVEDALTRELLKAQARVLAGPVMPDLDMEQFRQELAEIDFSTPRPLEELITWSLSQLEHGVVHVTHPRYFGLCNPAPSFPSQCADRISAAFNPQLSSSGSSPAPVEIEAHVIRAIARRAGFIGEAGGHFTTSGSEANYTALVCALTRANPRFGADGVQVFAGPVTVYTSRECQPAWFKIAHHSGIGRSAVRLIPTDGAGRMDVKVLAETISRDRKQGLIPVMISATAGTTPGGIVDPLAPCAQIAHDNRVWCHVDAAWGGAALCSDRLRAVLAGIELSDSITIDAHKWFATTMGCGMFVTRHPAVLSESFRVATDFMPSNVAAVDPYLTTIQWSRRFMGLRLFLSLGAAGWRGYAEHVERASDIASLIRDRLLAAGWSVLNDSQLAVLCVTPPAGFPPIREVARRVLGSGRAWVAASTFEGREVIRICVTHGETSLRDVDTLVSVLCAAG